MDWKRVFMERLDKETEKFADDCVERQVYHKYGMIAYEK